MALLYRNRRSRRFLKTSPALSLTPLIDTALTLLVVFMVAAPVAHRAVRVDLPRGAAETVAKQRDHLEVVVSVDHEGIMFLDGKRVEREAVMKDIEARAQAVRASSVDLFLAIDQRVPWNTVFSLFNEASQLPIEGLHVAFDITRPR